KPSWGSPVSQPLFAQCENVNASTRLNVLATQQKHCLLTHQVPKPPRRIEAKCAPPGVQCHGSFDLGPGNITKLAQVFDRAEMEFVRIPTALWQIIGLRHLAAHPHLQPYFPVSEVREGHNCVTTDAQHVFQYDTRLARCLQGLRQNDVVESVVRIV